MVISRPGEDGWIVMECPALPGCITQGRTEEEALANVREAICLYLQPEESMHLPEGARSVEVEL
jgi:predicted RNase H-like HicB family nuclease